MKLLSIIVPVYNVEDYLPKCLDSLLNQDISVDNYEIIIINDGSTDGSLGIASKYAESYPLIHVHSQTNGGLGSARNLGIKISQGESILFVDSDDYLQSNSLGRILTYFMEKQLEVLRFNYQTVDENYRLIPKRLSATHSIKYSNVVVEGANFLSNYLGWSCYVCIYLFKSSIIKNNAFFFSETIYFEDVEWLIRVLLDVKRVSSIDINVYNYLQRRGSITQSVEKHKQIKIVKDKMFVIRFLKDTSCYVQIPSVRNWCNGMIALTFIGLFAFIKRNKIEMVDQVKNLLYKEKFWPLKPYRFTIKQWRDCLLLNMSVDLFLRLK